LVGFRNRIAVLFNWAYVYLTRRRHAQLIIGEDPAPQAIKPDEREREQREPARAAS